MSLFLPRAGLDLPQSGACLHHLDMGIVLDVCIKKISNDLLKRENFSGFDSALDLFLLLWLFITKNNISPALVENSYSTWLH